MNALIEIVDDRLYLTFSGEVQVTMPRFIANNLANATFMVPAGTRLHIAWVGQKARSMVVPVVINPIDVESLVDSLKDRCIKLTDDA